MLDKKVSADEQLLRMKSLMKYGINENKQPEYSTVEYTKAGADGKLYGIVREGTEYYIKVAKDPKGSLVKENFEYIGGFRNRRDNRYSSFAGAQRCLGEKLVAINESIDDVQKRVITEAWDLDEKKEVIEEGTRKMQKEIARQKQIMRNAQNILEGKEQQCDMPCCEKPEEMKAKQPKDEPGAPFTEDPDKATTKNEHGNMKGAKKQPVKEASETPLSSRENPDYMDKSHGTEIGSSAPFDNPVEKTPGAVADADGGEAVNDGQTGNVNEEEAMHDSQNQNTPEPGTGEKGDTAPFDEKATVTEDLDDLDDSVDDELEDDELEDDEDLSMFDDEEDDEAEAVADGEEDLDGMDADAIGAAEVDVEEEPDGDVNARMDAIESKLDQLLSAITNLKYNDEPLYDGDDEESASEESGDDETEEEDEFEVYESKAYKAMKNRKMNEDRLNDFGKHPAYQKKVMTYPNPNLAPKDGDYDMNDSSVESEKPYGISKGNQKPYKNGVEKIENAITESVMRKIKNLYGVKKN